MCCEHFGPMPVLPPPSSPSLSFPAPCARRLVNSSISTSDLKSLLIPIAYEYILQTFKNLSLHTGLLMFCSSYYLENG